MVTQFGFVPDCWQYSVRGWLYRDIIFSLLTIFGQGVIISWHYIFTPDHIWWGGDYIVTFFTPEDIWWGGDYIAILQYHFWHSLLWRHNGRDSISNHQPHDCLLSRSFRRRSKKTSKLRVTGLWAPLNSPPKGQWRGALMFSLICIWMNGWVNNREPGYLRRYCAHYDVTVIFGEGVIISWHIFTPEDIWWGGDYIVTLQYHFWHSLLWRHNGRDSISNHQPHDCLLSRSFRRRSKKTSKLRVTGLWAGNSPATGEFPAQMASNAENVSIWWSHHVP